MFDGDTVVLQVETLHGPLSPILSNRVALYILGPIFIPRLIQLVFAREHLAHALTWLRLIQLEAVNMLADLDKFIARLLLHYFRYDWSFHAPMNIKLRHILRIQLLRVADKTAAEASTSLIEWVEVLARQVELLVEAIVQRRFHVQLKVRLRRMDR